MPIIGTKPDAIDRAEDRERFAALLDDLQLTQPANGIVRTVEEGLRLSKVFAYPLIVRPSYVLGGRDMSGLSTARVGSIHEPINRNLHDRPLLLDQFLDDAIEVDIDAVSDGTDVVIGGILEHIEQAGVHSGDSSCVLPPRSLSDELLNELRRQVTLLALELVVVGLINVQFAIKDSVVYLLEVNPRASRTSPFIAKATGLSLAKVAARCMVGESLRNSVAGP